VRHAVNLDDEFPVESDEIDYIPIDRMLATKFPACKPAIAQRLPKFGLRACFAMRGDFSLSP